MGYTPQGCKELDMIEQRTLSCVSKDFACILNLNPGMYSEEQLQLFLKKSNKKQQAGCWEGLQKPYNSGMCQPSYSW